MVKYPIMIELTAGKDDNGRRLDRILRKALPDYSLSLIHRLLRQKKILVDNKPATPNHRIEQGMVIHIIVPVNHTSKQVNHDLVNRDNIAVNNNFVNPKNLIVNKKNPHIQTPVPILWQGSGIIVFNKPQGLSTHGSNSLDSIVNDWLAAGGAGPLPRSLSFKPGPLHRLDKPTSGAIAFSQTLEGARLFSALLRERKIEKSYIAIVEGRIESEKGKVKSEKSKYGEIIWRDVLEHDKKAHKSFVKPYAEFEPKAYVISRSAHEQRSPTPYSLLPTPLLKEAITIVKTLASNDKYSLIEARIKTGRHHQIRAQAASHGHPLAGDTKYGGKPLPGSDRTRSGCFFLHAWKIKFNEQDGESDSCSLSMRSGRFPQEIIAPLPEVFQSQIEALFN